MLVFSLGLEFRCKFVSFHIELNCQRQSMKWSILILVPFDMPKTSNPSHLLDGLSNGLDQIPFRSHGIIDKVRSLPLEHGVDSVDQGFIVTNKDK